MRNASQGVGFHRVERLRKQKTQLHCSHTVGPFPHRKTRETSCSPATVWLAHAMYYVGLLSAVPSKRRQRHKTNSSDVRPFPHVEFNLFEFNFFSKIILFHKSQKHQTRRKRHAASRKMRNEVQLQKTLVVVEKQQKRCCKNIMHIQEKTSIYQNHSKFICGRITCSK